MPVGMFLLLLCGILGPFLSACGGDEPGRTATASAPQGARVALPPGTEGRDLEEILRRDLAARLGIPLGDVIIQGRCDVTWPDGSIGVAEAGAVYTQALVPGWLAILEAKGKAYRYHGTSGGYIAAGFVPGAKVDAGLSC
jgi:hypothetical protein